jgi:CelD/BcsL family acetyltransferase involved in cellulose biosynthesis
VRALEPNVFYEPAFALAAAPVLGRGAGAVLVWSGTAPRRLIGFFPARVAERRYGIKLPVLAGWTHPYAPLGTPLVEREAAEPVIAAWLAHLADNAALPGLLLLPLIAEDGPFAAALKAILRRTQMPYADFGRHARPLLEPRDIRARYVERVLSAHRQRELRRAGRRLADLGALMFTAATEPSTIAGAIEDFFVLEAGGWKGAAGTAAAYHADVSHFIATAISALAAEGKAAIDRILVDGHAIAAAIVLRSAGTAWYWKTAYDEKFARFAPGVLLTVALTEELAEDAAIARTDSCAVSGNAIMDEVWRERLALCDRLIALRPQAPFAVACRLEHLRGAAIAAVKTVRGRFLHHRGQRPFPA